MTDSIKLSPPLPWISDQGQTGFVTEISRQHLTLDIFEASQASSGPNEIRVMVGKSQSFVFSGQSRLASPRTFRLMIHGADSEQQLHDLLGQVRKDQHIEICRDQDVEASDRFTGFQRVQFIPEALPELSFDDLNTEQSFLGTCFDYPILITGMTGGVDKGTEINRRLALAAEAYNIPMGVGSQRVALDNPEYAPIFDVKKYAPNLFVIGNLGFAQLKQDNYLDLCRRAVDMVSADALAIHVNVLQEAIQMEGDRDFTDILKRLETVCQSLSTPIVIKEVGSGISSNTAQKLLETGIAAIDVGGRGGTSWGYIEGLRSSSSETMELAETFRNWGIPTAYSLVGVRALAPQLPLIATGGVRNGLTVAKAIALGADLVGIGLPLLRAALQGEQETRDTLATIVRGLKVAMIATGSRSLRDLEQHICLSHPMEKNFDDIVQSKSFY
ncbi:type 2 isopentenyl-diphosphate Delta-isomerase [Pseudobacteriovorax antillogorgiicola]|nr:type 2 isopentenyl-diphosphate Delta-isomerase [Pseudobacteriovorax antillogorgiicola]